jgi:IS30 family transposase
MRHHTAVREKVSIDVLPDIVETEKRFGDWEIDTVLDKHDTSLSDKESELKVS